MTWLNTHSGKHINYISPSIEAINIEDIAHALSYTCRYNGHIKTFYSVAQHSLFVSKIVSPEYALEALLHDAVEAYCCDIPSPLKVLLKDYQRIEQCFDMLIRLKFDLPKTISRTVKQADLIALATEKRDLNIDEGITWPIIEHIKPHNITIMFESPKSARERFLTRFHDLVGGA